MVIEPVAIDNTGVVNGGEVMEGGAEDGGGRERGGVEEVEEEEDKGLMGGRELGFEGRVWAAGAGLVVTAAVGADVGVSEGAAVAMMELGRMAFILGVGFLGD